MINWHQLGWHLQYGNVRSATHSLPSLSELRSRLGIKAVNTGQQSYPSGRAGIVTDDLEGLHAILDEQNRIQLSSGVENSIHAYRGQIKDYGVCVPTLGRDNREKTEKKLLALCRSVAFEDVIADHPFVRLTEQSTFCDSPLFVDKEGLAQHYGLSTNILDVTSNFDVASFFATCAWNTDTCKWAPFTDIRHQDYGVIYRLVPCLLIDLIGPDDAFYPFHIIGWQPLPRPEQQRAFAVKMKPAQDFCSLPGIECFRFKHCVRISHHIWQAFDEGRLLFPDDAAAELAIQAEGLHQFTRSQIDRAWQRLENWTNAVFSINDRSVIESRCDISELKAPLLSWDGLDVETDEKKLSEKLQDVLNRVRYRRVMYI